MINLHFATIHYTMLHYTTLHFTSLHFTSLHFASLHKYTMLHDNFSNNYNYTSLITWPYATYITPRYITLHKLELQLPLQLQLHYITLRCTNYISLHRATPHYATLPYPTRHSIVLHYFTTFNYITVHCATLKSVEMAKIGFSINDFLYDLIMFSL